MRIPKLFVGIIILFLSLLLSGYPAFAANSSLTNSHQLTSFGSEPSLSPNGKELVFVNYSTYGPSGYPTEIWAIGTDGSNPRLLITTPENIQALNLKFSPDGNKIAFIGERQDEGNRTLFVMEHDGSNVRTLSDGGNSKISAFTWISDDKIVFAQQESENSVEFLQVCFESGSADTKTSLVKKITMEDTTRFIISENVVSYDNGAGLLFTGFGVGQGKSDIFSLNLQTGDLEKMDGMENSYVLGLGSDGHTIFIGRTGGENSVSLYSTDLENPSERTLLLEGNFDYSIHENATGKDPSVAYAFAPGGVASSDLSEWSRFGIYMVCPDGCGSPPVIVFSDGYVVRNGQYVNSEPNNTMTVVVAGVLIASGVGAGAVVYVKKMRRKNLSL